VLALLGATLVVRRPSPAEQPLGRAAIPPIAACVGVVGGIYGIGGGSFLAPIMILGGYTAYAVAPAAALHAGGVSRRRRHVRDPRATVDASGPISPDWGVRIAAGAGGVIGAYVGASLQSRIPEPLLRRLLGWAARRADEMGPGPATRGLAPVAASASARS
jgi:hypothetical protein